MSEIKINKGIELMLRRAKKKEDNKQKKPTKGFSIKQTLTLLKEKSTSTLKSGGKRHKLVRS